MANLWYAYCCWLYSSLMLHPYLQALLNDSEHTAIYQARPDEYHQLVARDG